MNVPKSYNAVSKKHSMMHNQFIKCGVLMITRDVKPHSGLTSLSLNRNCGLES